MCIVRHAWDEGIVMGDEVLRLSGGGSVEERVNMGRRATVGTELRLRGVGACACWSGDVGGDFGGEDCGR